MTLDTHTRIGAYEIIALPSAPLMREVYRARDIRLVHKVAIKVLPNGFARESRQ